MELNFFHIPAKASIDSRFAEFNQQNPQVYWELVRLAREWKKAGKTKIGIRMLWEVMRWNLSLQTKSEDDFKLNDHFTSRYVRLIMTHEKDLAGMFEIRTLRAE